MAAASHADASHGSEPRTAGGSSSFEEVPPGAVQKYWTPNIGCNIRISLATGIPEYDEYVKSISWATRRGLRNCGGDGRVGYFGSQARKYPKAILPQMIKLRPDSVPLYPGHEEKSAYFPFGETAVTDLLEGQLAFLHHVRSYEEAHPGTRFMQRNLCWKFEFLNCCIGSLPKEQLDEISSEINAVVQLGGSPNSWAVRSSKAMSKALRHTPIIKLGHYLEASMEQLEKHTSLKPFSWEPRKFFSFLMANSKGRFQTWIAPAACSYKRFLDWDFVVGISAIQGHSRVPEQVSEAAQGEKLTLARARELGYIFHATDNANYESIKSNGLSIRATRKGWQRHRVAIHFTYAGGTESPGPGTVIRYGANTFYARLDYESFFNHGHELFLTDNGVVLCYQDIAPMYLTFHYRPPHEQDPGGLKHEEKQRAAGVSSSFEEETPSAAADSSEPTGGSPSGEEPVRRVQQKAMPKKKAKAKASTDAESATGGSPSGEVPVVDEAALRRLIREDELREEAARRPTTSEGTARYAYEAGDTVHGRVDATRLQQEEELRDIIQKARYNPWHFFHHGLLHRKDQSGNKMYAPYGDALVKTTPFSSLPTDMRKLLGSEYNWTSWCCHPLSGYGVHFFLKGFELGKMQGNMLLELNIKAKAYTDGYKSPFDQGQGNDPSTILTDLQHAEHREFAPLFAEIGFKNPEDSDSRSKKPKPDDPDYAIKLALHNAFCLERDVWTELKAIRKDFSTVVAAVSQAYGPDFFGYIQKHWENLDIRRQYKINTPEGHILFDSSLRERWNAPLVLAAIDKQFKSMGVGSFTSTFGKKAHSDLIAYEALRAKREKEVDELYTRPFEDLVVEEFISNLPVPTIEEVDVPMEQAGGSADAAPADSSFEEMAGVEEAKQEPDSAAPMDVDDVPMDTEAPGGSSFEEVPAAKEEDTTVPPVQHSDDPTGPESSSANTAGHPGSSPSGEAPIPEMNFSADASKDQDNTYEQGIWGKTKTRVDPKAFESKATADAEEKNEQAFERYSGEKEKETLSDTSDFMHFHDSHHLKERMSPLMRLSEQIHGYGKCGLYHDDIRLDKINGFKVQHMFFRQQAPNHPHMKFNFAEEDLMDSVNQMEPIYDRRTSKMNVVFRTGDYRSTLDDKEMARASTAREQALELNQQLLERLRELNKSRRSASREELMNAMLHYFLAVGVDDGDLGDLSLERMPKPIGPAEEGPVPIYNSRSKYTALVLNLGSFARNRKRSAPSTFSNIIDYDDSGESVGLLLKSIAHAKAHLFLLCEAGELNERELDFLHRRGWQTQRNPNGELLVGCRTNNKDSSMAMLAGSTLVGVAHDHLPLTYMIVDIKQGKTLPFGSQGSGTMRNQVPKSSLTAPLTRAGMNSMRVCVFHLSSQVASGQVSLPHEALASMFIDCLFYQVDFIGGDPNMALYRYGGTKQGSMDIQGGMYQSVITYLLDGWRESPRVMPFCIPRAQHCSANSLLLLKQYEDALGGQPYKHCPKTDWNTFPGLDPMVATVLEWGHSLTDDEWAEFPEDTKEFKLSVSEWLLNSTSANYLLKDTDHDSHTPLLLTVNSTNFSAGRARQMNRNPDTLQEKAERRKQRQKENKARGSAGAASSTDPSSPPREAGSGASSGGATASGSQRPAEPADPPSGKSSGKGSKGSKGEKGGKSSKGKEKGGSSIAEYLDYSPYILIFGAAAATSGEGSDEATGYGGWTAKQWRSWRKHRRPGQRDRESLRQPLVERTKELEREKVQLTSDHAGQVSSMSDQIEELRSDNERLQERIKALEKAVGEATHQVRIQTGIKQALDKQVLRLQDSLAHWQTVQKAYESQMGEMQKRLDTSPSYKNLIQRVSELEKVRDEGISHKELVFLKRRAARADELEEAQRAKLAAEAKVLYCSMAWWAVRGCCGIDFLIKAELKSSALPKPKAASVACGPSMPKAGTVSDSDAARALILSLLDGDEDLLFKVRRESRRSVYVILKVAEANAEPILQRLRAAAASVKILDRDTFMSRVQTDESLKRKREQQDEALRATDSSLVGRLLALRGDGGDSKSRRRDGSRALAILNRLTAVQASGLRTREIVTNEVDGQKPVWRGSRLYVSTSAAPAPAAGLRSMAPKTSLQAKLIFSPQKRQRKTTPSADKLEVFIIRYSEKAQLVSETFDENQACFQIDVTHGGKPSMLYRLKDHMLEFLQSASVDGLPTNTDDLATENQTRLCVAKNKNNDWKSGFFTVEANVLFVLNLLELFMQWRLRQEEFRGCILPEVLLYVDPSVDVKSWVSQSDLQITFVSEAASFSALQAVAPATGGHLCVELRQQDCPDGSGSGVVVVLSGNTYPLQSLFSDWKGEGSGATFFRTSRVYRDSAELSELAQRLMPLQSVNVKIVIGFEKYPTLEDFMVVPCVTAERLAALLGELAPKMWDARNGGESRPRLLGVVLGVGSPDSRPEPGGGFRYDCLVGLGCVKFFRLEVFLIRYCEDAQLVSESFDEGQMCVQVDLTHAGKPSLLFKLKENMLDFLQSDFVSDLPTSADDLAANNQVRLCVSKSKNGDWKSGFFTVEANVLFVLNLLELFVHWRSRKDDFSGLALPEVLLYSDPSLDITAWVSQSLLQVTLIPDAASFSAVQAVAPSTHGHLCVELQQQACPDGSGAGVFVQLSGNTYPLQSVFSDWKSDGAGATYVRYSRVYKDPHEVIDLAQRVFVLCREWMQGVSVIRLATGRVSTCQQVSCRAAFAAVKMRGFSGSRAHIVELAQEKVGLRMDNSGILTLMVGCATYRNGTLSRLRKMHDQARCRYFVKGLPAGEDHVLLPRALFNGRDDSKCRFARGISRMIHPVPGRAVEPVLPLLQQEFERLADEGTCIHQYVLRLQDKVREARLRGQHSEYLDLLSSLLAAVSMERHTASGSEPASAAVGEWVSRWWAKICELGILQVSEAAGSAPLIVLSTQATEDEAGQEEEERGLQSRCGGMQDEEEERFFGVDVLRDRRGSSGDDENSGSESWESEAERVREMYEGSDARERVPGGGGTVVIVVFQVNCVRVVQGYVEEDAIVMAMIGENALRPIECRKSTGLIINERPSALLAIVVSACATFAGVSSGPALLPIATLIAMLQLIGQAPLDTMIRPYLTWLRRAPSLSRVGPQPLLDTSISLLRMVLAVTMTISSGRLLKEPEFSLLRILVSRFGMSLAFTLQALQRVCVVATQLMVAARGTLHEVLVLRGLVLLLRAVSIADFSGPATRSFGANVLGASAYDSEAMGYSAHWGTFGAAMGYSARWRVFGTVESGRVLAIFSVDVQRWQGELSAKSHNFAAESWGTLERSFGANVLGASAYDSEDVLSDTFANVACIQRELSGKSPIFAAVSWGTRDRSFGANVLGASAYDSEAMGYSAHWRAFGTVGLPRNQSARFVSMRRRLLAAWMLGHGLTEFGIGHGYGYGLYGPYGPQPTMTSTVCGPVMMGPMGQPIAAHMSHVGAPGIGPLMSLMGPVGPAPMMRHASQGLMPGPMLASGIGPINAPPAPHYLGTPSSPSEWGYDNNGRYHCQSQNYKDTEGNGGSWWTWNKKKQKNKRAGASGGSEPRWKKPKWGDHDGRYGGAKSPRDQSGGDGGYGGGGDGVEQDSLPREGREATHGDDGGKASSGDHGRRQY
ncbi:hypothetical protein AK812_SmicGene7804 [Symbiodinium microadriaticum]|uniref:Uncharacterized protein n=1 Tax=Symbiodinium microadriaticum TaxID=2951 RepID=A0A1Q9EMN2_SYMMI|nr:hypothetical protein AK812_SmicGene7804 [Symbiodinium microadriaticum]